MRLVRGLMVVTLFWLIGTTRAAPPSREAIAQAIQQLGDQRFAVREKASAFLKAAGRAAEPALREAIKSRDLEVARRAQVILDDFKWGIYPDTPLPLVELIHRYRSGDEKARQRVLGELFAKGKQGYPLLAKIARAEEDPEHRLALQHFIGDYLARTLPLKLAAGDYRTVEDLLEVALATHSADASRHYAAFLSWRGELDSKIAEYKALLAQENDAGAAETLAFLCRAKGDLVQARAAAEKAGKPDLLEAILFEQGDWKGLLQRPLSADNQDAAWALGVKAAYLRRAGRLDEFDHAVRELRKFTGGDAWSGASALFFNDRPNEAIALLSRGVDPTAAFELLAVQWKFREALELVEKAKTEGTAHRFGLEVLQARTFYRLGDKDKALAIFHRLGKEMRDEPKSDQWNNLIQTESKLGLTELAFEHGGQYLDRQRDDVFLQVFEHLFPKQAALADAWWRHLRITHAKENPSETLLRVRRLFENKLSSEAFTALAGETDQAVRKLVIGGNEYSDWLRILAETSQALNRDDLARKYLEKRLAVPKSAESADAHLRLGNFLFGKTQWKEAAEQFRLAWEKDPQRPVPVYLRGRALMRAGQEKEGRALIELAHRLPLGNEEMRYQLAEALQEHGLQEEARRELELLARLGTMATDALPNALGRLADAALARKEYLRAAAYMEQVVLLCLRTQRRFVKTEGYLVAPLLIHHYRVRGLVATGQPREVIRGELRHCLDVMAADANLPIHLVAELTKRGRQVEADEVFGPVFAEHERICKEYPRSAMAHNGLGWLAARCRRHLDKALEHAHKAVELAPDDPAYADTLAEVYFQRGSRENAMKWIRKCIDLDPKREYFRRQLKRFEEGDPTADVIE